jgi:hypothetical protein
MPQPPQLPLSEVVSAHTPPQFVRGKPQGEHTPFEQTGVASGQTFPQAPQLLRSWLRSTQSPLLQKVLVGHEHAPFSQ